MEMIAMSRVVVGTQHHVPDLAGAVADGFQEPAARVVARPLPVASDADRACRRARRRDVERVGSGMLAAVLTRLLAARPAADVAAGIAAEVLDGDDVIAERRLGRPLQRVALPHRQRDGRRARARSAARCASQRRHHRAYQPHVFENGRSGTARERQRRRDECLRAGLGITNVAGRACRASRPSAVPAARAAPTGFSDREAPPTASRTQRPRARRWPRT